MNRFSPERLFTQGELLTSLKVTAEYPSTLSVKEQSLKNVYLLLKVMELLFFQGRLSVSTFNITFIRFRTLKFWHFVRIKPEQLIDFNEI